MFFRRTAFVLEDASPATDTLRTIWPTVAEPSTFAPPIDVREDDQAITLLFAMPGWSAEQINVELRDQTLFVFGGAPVRMEAGSYPRPLRAFSLHMPIEPMTVQANLSSNVLTVHIMKSLSNGSRRIVGIDST